MKKKQLILSILYTIIFLIALVVLGNMNDVSDKGLKLYTFTVCIIIALCIFIWIYFERGFSIFNIFVFTFIVCIFSKPISVYLLEKNQYNYLLDLFTRDEIKKTILLSVLCFISLFIGASLSKKDALDISYKNKSNDYYLLKHVAWILFIISFPASIYNFIRDITLALEGGYSLVYTTDKNLIQLIITVLSNYLYISLILLLLLYKKKRIFIIAVIYYGLQIFIGNRGIPIIRVIVLLFIYNKYIQQFNKKQVFLSIIGGYIAFVLFDMIAIMRSLPLSYMIKNIGNIFLDSMQNNPILNILNEVGTAFIPTVGGLHIAESYEKCYFGMTYIYTIINAIPLLPVPNYITILGDTANYIASFYGIAFGGSVIGEAFINFKYITPIFIGIMGFVINNISNKFNTTDSKWKIAIMAVISTEIVWLVRNSTLVLISSIINSLVIPIIIYYVVKSFVYHKN